MDNIMSTLVMDRTQADVDRTRYLNGLWDPIALQWRGTPQERAEWEAGPRGAYGFADMNRVTQAAAYLIGQLEKLGYSMDIEDVTPAYNIQVSVDPAGSGTASGAGVFYDGDTAAVTAQPSEKYDFAGWMEDGQVVSDSASYTFTVTGPRNLTAAFALKKFQVTVSVDPSGAGEVTGAGTYDIDTEVTVAATAGDGYVFARWTENGETVSEGPQYTFTLDQDRALSAVMTKTYVISVTANDTDGGTVSGSGTYLDGQTVTVAAVAGDGYEFAGWSENGSTVSAEAVYTFQAEADRELVAVFVKTYVITLLVDPAGGGTVLGGGTYREGAQVTISATAGDGYRFAFWRSGGKQVSASNPYTITVTGDQTLTALFEEIPVYTIAAAIDPEGSGTVTGAGQYREGATVTLVATPSEGYKFSGWQEGGQTVSTETTYTFTATEGKNFVVSFEEATPSRLPTGYVELEYIMSDKNCGIDTGTALDLGLGSLTMEIEAGSYGSGYEFILDNAGSAPRNRLRRSSNTALQTIWNMSNTAKTTTVNIAGKRMTISISGGTMKVGNLALASTLTGSSVTGSNVYLFHGAASSTSYSYYSIQAKLYSCKMYSSAGLIIRDFVPCKNPSGIVGLFDIVGQKFYQNSKSGKFTAGPAA